MTAINPSRIPAGIPLIDAANNATTGVDITRTLEPDNRVRIQSIQFTFTVDATVISRIPFVAFFSGPLEILRIDSPIAINASVSSIAFAFPGAGFQTGFINNRVFFPLPPDLLMERNWDILIGLGNRQAGDLISNTTILYERFARNVP